MTQNVKQRTTEEKRPELEIKDGVHTTTLPDTTPTFTHEEWIEEGTRRFGACYEDWKFICPICKNIAAIGDYKQYKDKGATPQSATTECIGRYTGTGMQAFGDDKKSKPCNYALYGLFRLPGSVITMPDGEKIMSFAFAEVSR